jgi:hypothetical protein
LRAKASPNRMMRIGDENRRAGSYDNFSARVEVVDS